MSLELVNTVATLGTFLVIAATAIAAIVQLRHMRGSNQIAALNELRETSERAEFRASLRFVVTQLADKLADPAFRVQILDEAARTPENEPLIAHVISIGNFYESMGVLVRNGLVDRDLALEIWNSLVVRTWRTLAPVTAMLRRKRGPVVWENFEYLAVLSEDWDVAYPKGTYPPRMRRLPVEDVWLNADERKAP